jgi:hypothetical protein
MSKASKEDRSSLDSESPNFLMPDLNESYDKPSGSREEKEVESKNNCFKFIPNIQNILKILLQKK